MTKLIVPDGTLEQTAAGKARLTIPALGGVLADPGATWAATHVYSLGARVKDTATVVGESGVAVFECVVAGTSDGTTPFGYYPGYVTDGTAAWLYIGYIGGLDCRLSAPPVAYAHDGDAYAGPSAITDGAGRADSWARSEAAGAGTATSGVIASATAKTAYVEVEATSAGASLAIHDGTHVGDAGQVLTSDGTHAAWAAPGGGGSDLVQTYAGAGSVYVPGLRGSPDAMPASPNADDDEFDAASTFSTVLGALDLNSTSDAASHLYLLKATSGAQLDGVYKAAPAIPFTVTTRMTDSRMNEEYNMAGLMVGDSTPTAWLTFGLQYVAGVWDHFRSSWSNRTTRASYASGYYHYVRLPYMRFVVASATSLVIQISEGGLVWMTVESLNPGFSPANVGLFLSGYNAVRCEAAFDYVRFVTGTAGQTWNGFAWV